MKGASFGCTGISKGFSGVRAVEHVSLDVEPGETLALVGPSGCGKTTLLRIISGFEAPDEGVVALGGQVLTGPGVWVPPEARRVSLVFQDYALFPHMTLAQNVAFGLKGWSRREQERRVKECMALARLEHLMGRYPHELSGGEQQRAALARALAPQPMLLLLDEPFSNLDANLRTQVREELREILSEAAVTSVFVTHHQEEALFMGHRVAVMREGCIEQADTPEGIFHRPATKFVAKFMAIADFLPAVRTPDGLRTEAGPPPPGTPAPEGDALEVMVRPDDVIIRPSPEGQGRIVGRVFQGFFYLYTVALPSGAVVHSLASHTQTYVPGTRVDVSLEAGHPLLCFANGRAVVPKGSEIAPGSVWVKSS
ncbi:MAG: ABC transporter ATP-binding protein [Chloroflexi bacterium]|nr:ABC transporter ATP-binding protein [Chloroflexota bacterium]